MNCLLDTHVYLWIASEPHKLSPRVTDIFLNPEHTIYLSAVSIWEMQIKIQTGKLVFPKMKDKIIEQLKLEHFKILSIDLPHIYALDRLPLGAHRDPFDRLLVAQALYQGWPMLTQDPLIAQYAITTIW